MRMRKGANHAKKVHLNLAKVQPILMQHITLTPLTRGFKNFVQQFRGGRGPAGHPLAPPLRDHMSISLTCNIQQ